VALMGKPTISVASGESRVRLGVVALALLLMLGLLAGGITWTHQSAKQEIVARFQAKAVTSAGFISTYVSQQAAREKLSAEHSLAGRTGLSAALQSLAWSFGGNNDGVLDQSSRVVDIYPYNAAVIGKAVAGKLPQVREAESGGVGVSGVYPSVADSEAIIAIATAFPTPEGRRVFAVGYPVGGSVLEAFVDHTIPHAQEHRVLLVDGAGSLVAASPATGAKTLLATSPAIASALAAKSHGAVTVDGHHGQFVTAAVSGTPWRLVMAEPDTVLFATIDGPARWAPWIVFGMIALLGLALLALFSSTLAARAEALEASRVAVEASRAKSEFVASMSHELRTPLNGVIGLTALLGRTSLDSAQSKYVDGLARSGRALLAVIGDVLDFSKMEADQLVLDNTPFDLRAAVEDATEMLSEQARAKSLELTHWVDADVPETVNGDRGRLRQILLNMLSNAVKFTAAGEVTLRVARGGGDVLLFSVEDSGIGIDGAHATHLFEAFAQGDQSTTRQYGGTGLGLAIAQRLVRLMAGEIGARPRESGGSVFWFTAVMPAAAGVAQAETLTTPVRGAELHAAVLEALSNGSVTPQRAPAAEGSSPAHDLSVLLAEDNEINITVAKGLLNALGLRTTVAHDGREAVELAARHDYDAIFMDLQMPNLDGYDATRQIRSAEKDRRVPIIAMTAHALEGDRERCLAAGMDDHIAKPLEREDVEAVVERCLRGRERTPGESPGGGHDEAPGDSLGPAVEDGVLDQTRILGLRATLTQQQRLALLGTFDRQTTAYVAAIAEAIRSRDDDETGRVAHQLKGASASLGAIALASSAQQLSDGIGIDDPAFTTAQISALGAAREQTAAALRQQLVD
jgi:signal transduction histidine kinase/DNA-binding response OmpR family regulator